MNISSIEISTQVTQTPNASNPKKLHGLDHLRAVAITSVFLFHYFILSHGEPKWLPAFAKFGWTGVDLFFVLSGFLIASPLLFQVKQQQSISFKQFFVKRFFRIIPAYWFTLAIYFLVPFFKEKKVLPPLWKFLTFTQNIGLDLKSAGAFSHGWSLCVEEHFYLVLPMALMLILVSKLFNKAYWLLIVLFVAGFFIRLYGFNQLYLPHINDESSWVYWYKYIYYPTYNRLDGLLAGVSIAAIYQFLPNFWARIAKHGNLFLIVGLLVLTGAYFLCVNEQSFQATIFGFPVVAIGYGLLVIGAISPNSFLYKWNSKITTFIATLSYAIYLTHKGIIHITHMVLQEYKLDNNLLLMVSTVACVFVAYLIHILIEKPCMQWRNKLLG